MALMQHKGKMPVMKKTETYVVTTLYQRVIQKVLAPFLYAPNITIDNVKSYFPSILIRIKYSSQPCLTAEGKP